MATNCASLICGPRGETLYPSTRNNPSKYRPSTTLKRDMRHAITQRDHAQALSDCTQLVCGIPVLAGAMRQMSEWAFAGDSWQPIHYGLDEEWGELAAEHLSRQVFSRCVRRTPYKSLIKAMQVSAQGWLSQGDDLALFGLDAEKNPRMTVIPATCIGNGDKNQGWWSQVAVTSGTDNYAASGFGICLGGAFDGYRIYNGLIYDDEDEPIAVRVLGWKRDGKDFKPTYADFRLGMRYGAHMAFPYDWHGMGRPMPRIASATTEWKDFQERDEAFQKGTKLAATKTLLHQLGDGQDAPMALGDGMEMIKTTDASGNETKIWVEKVESGDVTYIGSNEELKGLDFQNPHPNIEEFSIRKLRECLVCLGWPYALVDPSSTSRAPTRQNCELANNSIWNIQVIGEERMFWFTKFAIATEIEQKRLPMPKRGGLSEPYLWTFGYPKEMSVDQGNDVKAMLEMLRYGITSQRLTSAKWGYVQKRIDRDREKEAMSLLGRVKRVYESEDNKTLKFSPREIKELFWQPSANSASVNGQQNGTAEEETNTATATETRSKPGKKPNE